MGEGGGARLIRGDTANGPCGGKGFRMARVSEDEVLLLYRALVAYRSGPPAGLPGEGQATPQPVPAPWRVPALGRTG